MRKPGGGFKNKIMTDNEMIMRYMDWVWSDNELITQYEIAQAQYASSWDQLMRVIEKISHHIYEIINVDDGISKHKSIDRAFPRTFGLITDDQPPRYMFRFNRAQLHYADSLIEAAYSAVVQWIKDYNEGIYTPETPQP
jgi:hypothetical protein